MLTAECGTKAGTAEITKSSASEKQKSPRNLRNESEGFRSLASRTGQGGSGCPAGCALDMGSRRGFFDPLSKTGAGGAGRAGAGTALEVVLRR
jgi:hypothetical protein